MPDMDATAAAALATDFAPARFIWCDFLGDPLRVTTFGANVAFASTGDPDLDGQTFAAFDGRAISVSPVSNGESGSDTLTIELSGIVTLDAQLLADIADTSKWRGRTCRLWFQIYDATGVTPKGAIVPHYTGYMTSVEIDDSPTTQTIRLSVENYLAAFNQPSNRSYLNQKDYDPADNSAAATLAAANGARHGGGGGAGGGGGGGMTGTHGNVPGGLLVQRF